MTKTCPKCGESKDLSLDNFYTDKKQRFKRWCKKCHNSCVSARSKVNRESRNAQRIKWRESPAVRAREAELTKIRNQSPEQKEKMKKWQKEWRTKNPLRWMMQVAKARAKKDGCPFDEDTSDISSIPEFCPILGIPLFTQGEVAGPNSPSLDKIIPELGYVKSNRWIISNRANAMKNDATLDEVILLGKWAQGEKDRRG